MEILKIITKGIIKILKGLITFLRMILSFIKNILYIITFLINSFFTEFFSYVKKFFYGINKLLNKTKYKKHIIISFSFLSFIFIFGFLFQKELQMFQFDTKIRYMEYKYHNIKKDKEKNDKKMNDLTVKMKDTINQLKIGLEELVNKEQEVCVNETLLDFLKEQKSLGYYVEDDFIEIVKLEAKNNICKIENFRKFAYDKFIDFPIKEELEKHFDVMVKKDEQKEKEREKTINNYIGNEIVKEKSEEVKIETFNKIKYDKGDIKAVFCEYGHGDVKISRWGSWRDRGAVSKDFTNQLINDVKTFMTKENYNIIKNNGFGEREFIEEIMDRTCDKMEKQLGQYGVKVYKIGRRPTGLKGKINEVNEISERNGYNFKNSLLISLHMNSLPADKKGVEIFYALPESEHGKLGKVFASQMLEGLKKIHTHGNFYNLKNDTQTRFHRLGLLRQTEPLSILIEMGSVKNIEDVKFNIKNLELISDTIVKNWKSFMGY